MDKITIERETLRSTLDVLTEMPPSPGKALVVSALRAALAAQPAVKKSLTVQPPAEAQQEPVKWRCFHCNECFTVFDFAQEHFGRSEHSTPMCKIDATEYRAMEERMRRYNEEDSDLHRELHREHSKGVMAAKRAEEVGYARGLKDGGRPAYATLASAPTVLNTNDRAMWVIGWNECLDAIAAQPAPAAVPLTDEKIDHTLATTLDEFARTTRGMSHALDVNADITANSRLRRMFARAVLAAAGDKP